MRNRVYASVGRLSVCPSVCPVRATAVNFAAVARREGDIDRLLHGAQQQRRAAGECGQCHVVSVRSSRTQTCYRKNVKKIHKIGSILCSD